MNYFLILCFLTIGFMAIILSSYFDNPLIVELLDYYMEIKVEIVLFLIALLLLLSFLFIHLIFYLYTSINKIKFLTREKIFSLLTKGYMSMELNDIHSAHKFYNQLKSKKGLDDNEAFLIFKSIINFKIKKYDIAKKYLVKLDILNIKLSELFIEKLIKYTLLENNTLQEKIQILEDLATVFTKQYWINILHAEIFRLKKDWKSAILSLEKSRNYTQYPIRENLTIFHYALAQQLYDINEFHESIAVLNNSPNQSALFIVLLKAKLYNKINKIKRSLSLLEESYKNSPHTEIAILFLCLTTKYYTKNKLYNIAPDYYFSLYIKADEDILLGNYDLAAKCLNTAIARFPYTCFYYLILKLKILSHSNYNELFIVLEKINSKKLINPFWQCSNCKSIKEAWWYECDTCNFFNSICWIIP